MNETPPPLFGIAAEFATEWQIVDVVAQARKRSLGRIETYTPVPVAGLAETTGVWTAALPTLGPIAALGGVAAFFGMCVYATTVSYPFIIGNRPFLSWQYFVIPSVSFGMLAGALATTLGMMFLNRLPRLNHPAFNIDGFERASRDRYFMTVEARDEQFDADAVERFLQDLTPAPLSIQRVPR